LRMGERVGTGRFSVTEKKKRTWRYEYEEKRTWPGGPKNRRGKRRPIKRKRKGKLNSSVRKGLEGRPKGDGKGEARAR